MVRRHRVLGLALCMALTATGCAHSVSGDAGPGAVVPSSPSTVTPGSVPASSFPLAVSSAALPPVSSAALPPVSSAAPTPAVKWLLPAPASTPRKNNQFGNQIATVGSTYAITYGSTQQAVLRFVVDSIKLDGRCDHTNKPANGHFLIISLRAQLAVTSQEASDDGIGFTADRWTAFDAKNVAQLGTDKVGGDCLTTSSFPFTAELESGELTSGKVALDVSATKGTVVLLDTISGGWVYQYG